MLLFGLFSTLMVIALVAALAWPLLRHEHASASPDADAASLAVYRDQKRALDAELAAAAISPAQYDAAIGELSRRLADEATSATPSFAGRSRKGWTLVAALIVLVPLASASLYYRLGNPAAVTLATIGRDKAEVSEKDIEAMVSSLAQRLKNRPDDAKGWALLARSYQALERFPEAADAFGHANALIPDDADLLVDYADALAMAQGRSLSGKPSVLVQRALAIDPEQRKALALAATAAMETHDFDRSIGYWKRLAATLPSGSTEAAQVNAVIAELTTTKTGGNAASPSEAADTRSEASTAPGDARPPDGRKPAPEAIAGRVEIAGPLAARVAPTDTVFIFARPVNGPRMPLAVLRLPATALPVDFTLDDSLSMAPNAKLSGAKAVVVEARISKHNTATPQSGDLFGRVDSITPGTRGVRIAIDQVVP